MRHRIIVTLAALLASTAALALKTDSKQPAVIDASEVEFDFKTGTRTYKGNVRIEQGTLRLQADKLVVKFANDKLQTATAWGNPVKFRQRPDGKNEDVYGEGKRMLLDETKNMLFLYENALLIQGQDQMRGKEIVYDMASDKLTVKGGPPPKDMPALKPVEPPAGVKVEAPKDAAATEASGGRSRVIVYPKQQESGAPKTP
jgi:lipopolysaccharide export system protein LptA